MTTAKVAERLGVNPSRVRQFIRDGRLKASKDGRDNYVHEDDLAAFIAAQQEMRPGPRANVALPHRAPGETEPDQ